MRDHAHHKQVLLACLGGVERNFVLQRLLLWTVKQVRAEVVPFGDCAHDMPAEQALKVGADSVLAGEWAALAVVPVSQRRVGVTTSRGDVELSLALSAEQTGVVGNPFSRRLDEFRSRKCSQGRRGLKRHKRHVDSQEDRPNGGKQVSDALRENRDLLLLR